MKWKEVRRMAKIIKGIGNWIKKHVLISIIIGVLVISGIASPFIIKYIKEEKAIKEEKNKTKIELNENLNIEINSDVFLISLIKKISNGELITENKKVDTTKLGEQEVVVKYLNEKEEEKEYLFKINIVDTTKPVIKYSKDLTTTVEIKIDLLKNVSVSDNSKEKITATVTGSYDVNKAGTYKLKYVAIDSSGNKTEEEFSLIVKSDPTEKYWGKYIGINNSESYNASSSFIELQKDGKFSALYNMCEGWIDVKGTYTINGNTLTLKRNSDNFNISVFNTMVLTIKDNNITVKSWKFHENNYTDSCSSDCNFDCSRVTSLKKK